MKALSSLPKGQCIPGTLAGDVDVGHLVQSQYLRRMHGRFVDIGHLSRTCSNAVERRLDPSPSDLIGNLPCHRIQGTNRPQLCHRLSIKSPLKRRQIDFVACGQGTQLPAIGADVQIIRQRGASLARGARSNDVVRFELEAIGAGCPIAVLFKAAGEPTLSFGPRPTMTRDRSTNRLRGDPFNAQRNAASGAELRVVFSDRMTVATPTRRLRQFWTWL